MIRFLAATCALAFALHGHCATFTVTLATDAGAANSTVIPFGPGAPGDLRNALFQALQSPGTSHVVDLTGVSGTIVLAAPLPPLFTTGGATLQIVGPGAGVLTISGNNAHRPFFILQGNVQISGMTIANGRARGGNGGSGQIGGGAGAGLGGAVLIDGTLGATDVLLSGVTFNANQALGGNGGNSIGFACGCGGGGGGGAGGNGGDAGSRFGGGGGFLGNGGAGTGGNTGGGGGGFSGNGGSGANGAPIGGGGAGNFAGSTGGGNGGTGGFPAGGGGGSQGFPGATPGANAVNFTAGAGGFGGGSGAGDVGAMPGDYGGSGGGAGIPVPAGGFGGGGGGAATAAPGGFGGGGSGGYNGGAGGAGSNGGGNGGAGTFAPAGGGGGGGGAMGGAVFVRAGTLTLSNTSFTNNTATGGTGGAPFGGAVSGATGTSNGGALFVNTGATAQVAGTPPVFTGNTATANGNVAGVLLGLAPGVTVATTAEDTQTTSGLVVSRNAGDAVSTHFKITGITGGTLFQADGTTPIPNGAFITLAQGNAGLKFTPAPDLFSPGATFAFDVQASTSATDAGLGGNQATATITVDPVADTPSVTSASTAVNTQTTSGLVIARNPVDGAEVTHFRITAIQNGTLYQNDGTTPIADGAFVTFAQGSAGLRFTPATNSILAGQFTVQASVSNAAAGLGGATVTATITVGSPVQTFTGPSPTGTGNITASFTGGGAACGFSAPQFIPLSGHAASPPANSSPAGVVFPHGIFSFTTTGCTPGSVLSFTISYPQPLPADTRYWKYGPTAGNPAPHWYVLPAVIAGNIATFSITDGGLGDDDLTANGTIVDQGGPGAGGTVQQVPTFSEWAIALLALLMLGTGLRHRGPGRIA